MTEKEKILLKKVKESDKDAFQQLFSDFHDALFRFVIYRVQDSDLAGHHTGNIFKGLEKSRIFNS